MKLLYSYARTRGRIGKLILQKIEELKRKPYEEFLLFLYRIGYIRKLRPDEVYKLEKVELLLRMNVLTELKLLEKFMPEEVLPFLNIVLGKFELHNVKNLLRLKLSKKIKLVEFFIPFKELNEKKISELKKYSNVNSVINIVEKILSNSIYESIVNKEIKNLRDYEESIKEICRYTLSNMKK